MNLRSLVWKEICQRPIPAISALIAVSLGVAALVAVQSVVTSSEAQVSRQMSELGANILVLPKSANLQDYYASDLHDETLPEEYVTRIILAQAVGVEEMAPKLCLTTEINETSVTLTGILPRSEFYRKSAWSSVDLMFQELESPSLGRKHKNCTGRSCQLANVDMKDLNSFTKTRVIHDLDADAVLVGSEIASELNLAQGDEISFFDENFRVVAVLPQTGTVDDQRVFVHLHTVQEISGQGPVVNVIEVVGCCEDVTDGLASELEDLLPEARVITISQLVETQVSMNRLMRHLSQLLFFILMLIGGASIASVMYANVSERRREFGTFMALGATPGLLKKLVLVKATLIGFCGGCLGLLLGLVLALFLGPYIIDVPPTVSLSSILIGLVSSLVVAILFSYFPAHKASRLDPCVCFQEV